MSNNTSKIDLPAIRARCSQSITEIVDNPREYYRVQQILRDRSDLLAEADRLRAALEAVKRHIEAAEGIEVAFRAAKHFAAAYNAADEALAGSQHETTERPEDPIELLTVARELLPNPDYEPSEDREISLRNIRDRIDLYLRSAQKATGEPK